LHDSVGQRAGRLREPRGPGSISASPRRRPRMAGQSCCTTLTTRAWRAARIHRSVAGLGVEWRQEFPDSVVMTRGGKDREPVVRPIRDQEPATLEGVKNNIGRPNHERQQPGPFHRRSGPLQFLLLPAVAAAPELRPRPWLRRSVRSCRNMPPMARAHEKRQRSSCSDRSPTPRGHGAWRPARRRRSGGSSLQRRRSGDSFGPRVPYEILPMIQAVTPD